MSVWEGLETSCIVWTNYFVSYIVGGVYGAVFNIYTRHFFVFPYELFHYAIEFVSRQRDELAWLDYWQSMFAQYKDLDQLFQKYVGGLLTHLTPLMESPTEERYLAEIRNLA